MDSPNLLVAIVITVLAIAAPTVLLRAVGPASEGIAQLFVPPDRTLGWPHGIQESDEPWGWHVAPLPAGPSPDEGAEPIGEIVELTMAKAEPAGVVVAVQPVHRGRAA